jgi:hypothetical protein
MRVRPWFELAVTLAVLGAGTGALAQSFATWPSLWGPGRKFSGDLFHSVADPLPDEPFRFGGKDWSLAFGVQYFARIESRDNADFSNAAKDYDTFVEHRARLSLRGSVYGRVGFLLEYQDVRGWGTERNTVTTEPFTGLHQGFVDVRATKWLSLRLGRQELSYGEDRLLGSLDWAMSARAFDGGFLRLDFGPVTVDVFGMLVRERAVLTDTSGARLPNDGSELYGIYGRWRPSKKGGLDLYALGLVNDPTTLQTGPRGARGIATLGGRGFLHVGPFSLIAEGAYQVGTALELGTNLAGDVRAWALAARASYTAPLWGNPYVAFELSRASGDGDPSDGEYRTFNQLFPTAHLHLGYMDYVAWQNVQGYRGSVGWRPLGAHVWVDVHHFRMVEPRGAWFDAAGRVFVGADPLRTAASMGTEMDISFTLPVHKHLAVAGAYGIFFPGDAARAAPGSTVGRGVGDLSQWAFLYVRSQF